MKNVPTNVNNHIEMFTLTETQFQTSKYYPIFSQEVSWTMTECDVFAPCKWLPWIPCFRESGTNLFIDMWVAKVAEKNIKEFTLLHEM